MTEILKENFWWFGVLLLFIALEVVDCTKACVMHTEKQIEKTTCY